MVLRSCVMALTGFVVACCISSVAAAEVDVHALEKAVQAAKDRVSTMPLKYTFTSRHQRFYPEAKIISKSPDGSATFSTTQTMIVTNGVEKPAIKEGRYSDEYDTVYTLSLTRMEVVCNGEDRLVKHYLNDGKTIFTYCCKDGKVTGFFAVTDKETGEVQYRKSPTNQLPFFFHPKIAFRLSIDEDANIQSEVLSNRTVAITESYDDNEVYRTVVYPERNGIMSSYKAQEQGVVTRTYSFGSPVKIGEEYLPSSSSRKRFFQPSIKALAGKPNLFQGASDIKYEALSVEEAANLIKLDMPPGAEESHVQIGDVSE